MTKSTKIQLRGNCPCCGRDQAVLASGRMSKHGYTVEQGWFQGVCSGDSHAPMQKDRVVTDRIIAQVDFVSQSWVLLQGCPGGRSGRS